MKREYSPLVPPEMLKIIVIKYLNSCQCPEGNSRTFLLFHMKIFKKVNENIIAIVIRKI